MNEMVRVLDVQVWSGWYAGMLFSRLRTWPEQEEGMPPDRVVRVGIGREGTTVTAVTSRPAGGDWATAASQLPLSVLGTDEQPESWLRVEWEGDATERLEVIGEGPDGCLVRMRLRPGEDGPEVAGLELSASAEGQVSAAILRRLGLDALNRARERVLQYDETLQGLAGGQWSRRGRRPGRAGQPDVFYAQWARRYVSALEVAPRAPLQHLIAAEESEGRFATTAQLRGLITRARKRGMLTPPPLGLPGGELTEKAKMLLGGGV